MSDPDFPGPDAHGVNPTRPLHGRVDTVESPVRRRRRQFGVAAGLLTLAFGLAASSVAGLNLATRGSPPRGAGAEPAPRTPHSNPGASTIAGGSVPTAPAGTTLVATTHGSIPGFSFPSPAPDTTVPGSWYGYPSILPVIATEPGWIDVRLAQRPNGSTTWVRSSDVTLGSTPYALVVNLTTMHLTVYENGTAVMDFPAGIGAPDDPTPPGNYFVTMTAPPPGPGYGGLVLVTSDHSDSFANWEGSGDAIIGIHGPITSYDDSLIGSTGAAISHGCIRLHDADLARLSVIPPGTPLDIVG